MLLVAAVAHYQVFLLGRASRSFILFEGQHAEVSRLSGVEGCRRGLLWDDRCRGQKPCHALSVFLVARRAPGDWEVVQVLAR